MVWLVLNIKLSELALQISLLFLSLLAGVVFFSVVLNRQLVGVRLGVFRKVLTLLALVASLVGFGFYGWHVQRWYGWWGWILPVGVLGFAIFSEMSQVIVQRRLRGNSAQTEGIAWNLLHPVTTLDLIVNRYQVVLPGWNGLGLRVVHLTDFHVTDKLPLAYFKTVVQRAVAEQPDLILITGDFVTYESYVSLLPEALAGLRAPLGVYAILGNHDCLKAAEAVIDTMAGMGVQFVGGSVVRHPDHPALALAGDEFPWGDAAPLDDWQPRPGEVLMVLTHTPDNIVRLTRRRMQSLVVFGGHFHGGQMRLPGFGAVIVPSRHGRRFVQGHFVVNQAHLFVSSGVGAESPPVRVFCPPEILVVDFKPKK